MGTDAAQPRARAGAAQPDGAGAGRHRARRRRPDYGMPPTDRMARGGRAVFFSDFLGDVEAMMPALAHAADQGVRGCFVQVLDESEEVFPFDGRMIFESMGGSTEFETQRARALREAYRRAAGRAARAADRRFGARSSAGGGCSTAPARRRARRCSGSTWRSASGREGAAMIGSVAFLVALAAARARRAAGALVAAARGAAGAGAAGVSRACGCCWGSTIPRRCPNARHGGCCCCGCWRWRRRSWPLPGRC